MQRTETQLRSLPKCLKSVLSEAVLGVGLLLKETLFVRGLCIDDDVLFNQPCCAVLRIPSLDQILDQRSAVI